MANIAPIPADSYKLGFIGAGKMDESIVRGVVKSGLLAGSQIRTAHHALIRCTAFESFGVKMLDHNKQLRPFISEKQLLVSVVVGVKLKDLQEWAGHSRFIRVMPNTPAAVGLAASGVIIRLRACVPMLRDILLSCTIISLGAVATKNDGEIIGKLFGAIGKVWTADEKLFDAITGLSGSGPAYIYLAIEALANGGVAAGLPRKLALGLASQTVLGAASMIADMGKHPGQLKYEVALPGGTTIAGIHELEPVFVEF